MPTYEYRCEACEEQFEAIQPTYARAEDTACPKCQAKKATRLMSMFASTIKGTHKPGFAEMKAYDMLNERKHKFAKLPPITGRRASPDANMTFSDSEGGAPEGAPSA
ncbi:MAG: zinc ribbon domain-containing protein [Nitrospiraceae bacterium]